MTTRALKEIDNIGGIDIYLLALDNDSVAASNYITKMRNIIGASLFNRGLLSEKIIRKLNYHKFPPNSISYNSANVVDEEIDNLL